MTPLLDLVATLSALDAWQAFAVESTLRATLALAAAALVGAALWRSLGVGAAPGLGLGPGRVAGDAGR